MGSTKDKFRKIAVTFWKTSTGFGYGLEVVDEHNVKSKTQ